MDLIWNGVATAFTLVFKGDAEVWAITWLSLEISGLATIISLLLGMPLGILLAMSRFPGRALAVTLVNTGMGLPPVVVGLFVSIFLWRSGPLGFLDIIYTPTAIIIAQVVIAFPIVAGLTLTSFQTLNPNLGLQLAGIGASRAQTLWLLCKEARLPLLAAVMAGFGGIISEVGASMMVGGNIRGQTRVLTTATVLETARGNFDLAIALSLILLALSFAINFILTHIQQRQLTRWPKPSRRSPISWSGTGGRRSSRSHGWRYSTARRSHLSDRTARENRPCCASWACSRRRARARSIFAAIARTAPTRSSCGGGWRAFFRNRCC